jgi:predicted NBD/HSP70 family sugar kinase
LAAPPKDLANIVRHAIETGAGEIFADAYASKGRKVDKIDKAVAEHKADPLRKRISELECAVQAALNMVDGTGVPPDWDWMRAVLADKTAEYFEKRLKQ